MPPKPRLALINSSMDLSSLGRYSRLFEPMPVLGLASLCAVGEQAGYEVRAFDQFVSQLSVEALAKQLESYAPSVVGIGVLTPVARVCEEIALAVKLRLPSCTVVAGNIHADFFSKEVLAWGSVDVVVHGEGEATFAELLEVLADSGPGDHLAEIAGISVRSSAGEVLSGPSRPLIKDLDTLPHPAWQHFPVHSYGLLPMADLAKPTLVMSASRGCPYRCEFCSLLHRGSVFRARDPRAVADEYSLLHSRFGARQIGFVDPVFPLAKKTCLEFCEEILRRGLQERVEWISETRVDCVDRHTLRMMRRSGCRRLLFGIESGVDLLLDGEEPGHGAGGDVLGDVDQELWVSRFLLLEQQHDLFTLKWGELETSYKVTKLQS